MLQILLADDHDITRQGMKWLLESQEPDWKVCAEARSGRDAVAIAERSAPNLAILDLSMPELSGIEAARQIAKVSPATRIVLFTMHASEQLTREALDAGVLGYVLKSDDAADVVAAVKAVAGGVEYVSSRVPRPAAEPVVARRRAPAFRELTPREREITQLLAEGKTNWCIAQILGISVKTVETHRWNIMHKLGLESIVELVHYAIRNELVDV